MHEMGTRFIALLGTSAEAPQVEEALDAVVAGTIIRDHGAEHWPFERHVTPRAAVAGPATIVLEALAAAFPGGQSGGTRLLTTQSTYQLQRWLDWLDHHPTVSVVADFAAVSLDVAREATARRGPWARVHVVPVSARPATRAERGQSALVEAFRMPDADARLRACLTTSRQQPDSPAVALALASAAMEVGELDEAHDALMRAVALDDSWEAAHFELGKLWLRRDDTERAAHAFRAAVDRMSTLAVAHNNLGAALAELERPDEALSVLTHAVALDPFGHTVHNNLGGALRDLGRLSEAQAAFRRVIELHPTFVFGHYNLGHALFLDGRFSDARASYEEGLRMDPNETPQQRARLALACAAAGDSAAALQHGTVALSTARDDRREDIRTEMMETLDALSGIAGLDQAAVAELAGAIAG